MFSQASPKHSDYQMPRTSPNYHLQQHQALLQQQLQVFHHFQAYQRHQFPSSPTATVPAVAAAAQATQEPQLHPQHDNNAQHHIPLQQVTSNNKCQQHQTSISPSHLEKPLRVPSTKPKRVRTIFTPEQLKRLEYEFNNQMYLVGHDRCCLADSLNLSEAQVKVWFQNRRIKHRKLNPFV